MSCEHHTEAEHHGAAGADEHMPLPSGRAGGSPEERESRNVICYNTH